MKSPNLALVPLVISRKSVAPILATYIFKVEDTTTATPKAISFGWLGLPSFRENHKKWEP